MIAEVDLFGVLLSSAFVSAIVGWGLHLGVRRALAATGFYRWVWHRSLADLAIYIILWAVAAAALPHLVAILPFLH
jgi:hypothetical protein